jgi:hypothetical protein
MIWLNAASCLSPTGSVQNALVQEGTAEAPSRNWVGEIVCKVMHGAWCASGQADTTNAVKGQQEGITGARTLWAHVRAIRGGVRRGGSWRRVLAYYIVIEVVIPLVVLDPASDGHTTADAGGRQPHNLQQVHAV